MLSTTSNHTNEHSQPQYQNTASATAAPVPPAASVPVTADVNSLTTTATAITTADAGAAVIGEAEASNLRELLARMQQLLDKATDFNIAGVFAQSAAKRLETIHTQLAVELLKQRQDQL
jgi:hypothetical protein